MSEATGPLVGLKILDISTVVAAPWAATLLADLGADVLKVEMPGGGDALRGLAPHKGDAPLWWKVANRNKRGVTLDLRQPEGREIFERLLPRFDVLVENFRPGTLDRWGLTKERLFALHPKLTILRVTGFGQTGPYARKPAFARIGEALSGLTYICGDPDRAPMHLGFPIADAVAGMFGAIGILGALHKRLREPDSPGQEIDVNLTESMFRVLDFLPIEYDQLGVVRERSGNLSQYAAPGNVYRTADGKWISLPASSQSLYERLCKALDRPDLAADPRFRTNPDRVKNRAAIDSIVAEEVGKRTSGELTALLDAHEVGSSLIYSIADIFADPHFAAREAIVTVEDAELGPVKMQNVVPRYSNTPGCVTRTGPGLGEHNSEIFGELLGLAPEDLQRLAAKRVI
ncbi:MAG: CoA transferase [Hyphomicrobiales bacterium]|nr:CoA transferase [Hyphomicrobiales bacterium]